MSREVMAHPQDPFIRGLMKLNNRFSKFFGLFISEALFIREADEYYEASEDLLKECSYRLESLKKTAVILMTSIEREPRYREHKDAVEELGEEVKRLLEELTVQEERLNWRALFVQRHFTAFSKDVAFNFVLDLFEEVPALEDLFVELSNLRDDVFQDSSSKTIEKYLKEVSSIREHPTYKLRYAFLENDTSEKLSHLTEELVALEDELSVRILFEDSTS